MRRTGIARSYAMVTLCDFITATPAGTLAYTPREIARRRSACFPGTFRSIPSPEVPCFVSSWGADAGPALRVARACSPGRFCPG